MTERQLDAQMNPLEQCDAGGLTEEADDYGDEDDAVDMTTRQMHIQNGKQGGRKPRPGFQPGKGVNYRNSRGYKYGSRPSLSNGDCTLKQDGPPEDTSSQAMSEEY